MNVMNSRVLFLLFLSQFSIAVDIGSDTAVTRFNTQQVLANGDRIAGFAGLNAGFALSHSGVTGIFDSFFEVSGNINLNFGTVELNQNLMLSNNAYILNAGNITGAGHSVIFSPSIDSIFPQAEADGCSISFLDSIGTTDNINAVAWSPTSEYVAIGLGNNGGNELEVYSWDGSTLTYVDGVSLGNDVFAIDWHPVNDWIGVGRDSGGGDELYNYSFNGTTLALLDSISFGGGGNDVRAVRWRPLGNYLAVGTDSNTDELRVYPVNGSGVFGTPATVNFAPNQDINTLDWNDDGTLVVVGCDSAGGDELRVYTFTTSPSLAFDSSFPVNQKINGCSWNKVVPNTDIIAIGLETGGDNIQLFRHSTGSLTQLPTTLGISDPVNAVNWHPNGICLDVALDDGGSYDLATYAFANDDLTVDTTFELGTNILACRWSAFPGNYLAIGEVTNDLSVYRFDSNFIDISQVTFSNLELVLNNDISISNVSINFQGESVINGNNNILSLNDTATIVVSEGSSLLFQNITLEGIAEGRMRLLDSLSTLSFEDVIFILETDFTFSQGRFEVLGDFIISGSSTFHYTTDQQSIIRGGREADSDSPYYEGAIILDHSIFNYAPASNVDSLLYFESIRSSIKLISGILQANTLTLLTGTMMIEGDSRIKSSNSISFGNGVEGSNFCLNILPAANLDIIGEVAYENV